MDGADPNFSVVIPLYDKRDHIGRALHSVLAQTYAPIEVIVVDDGSTDGGGTIVAAFRDPRVRLIAQANAGAGPARNTGMAVARGDWIALLDADDVWRRGHLEMLARVIAAFPDVDVVAAATQMVALEGLDAALGTEPPIGAVHRLDFFRDHRSGVMSASSVAIARAAFVVGTGFGAYATGEDMEYWIRLALHHGFAVSDCATALYVRGTDGTMERQQAAMAAGAAIAGSPIFATLSEALRDPAFVARRRAIAYFDRTKRLQYARSLLYHGRAGEARVLLAGTGARGLFLRALAYAPGGWVRAAAAHYSALKAARRLAGVVPDALTEREPTAKQH